MDKDKYIGRLLDNRYEILEVIGTGGMAVVYKARCHRLNRLVAIKILKDDNSDDEDFRRRFHAESQAVAMLSHPNIVAVYDVSTSLKADYIVMELIEGITLKQYMEKRVTLNWKETLHFAIQIAKALEHAHSKGIVHRDIKPHNVMVLKNGSVKVMDFGIARLISRGNTLTKEALGSVHYISPEQAKGGRVDNRSDIYSLGVVMYEMMTGRPPYDGDSPVSVAIKHINGGAVVPTMLNPNIPGGLEQIIMKAMAHNVDNRYPTATQMLADMEEFRKNPAIVFQYANPAQDAEGEQKLPLMSPKQKTATGGHQKKPAKAHQNDSRRRDAGKSKETSKRRNHRPQDQKRSRIAIIAIIICSLVAAIAIGIFMSVLLGGGFTPEQKLVQVPQFVGQKYAEIPEYENLVIIKDERYNDSVEAGTVYFQKPEAGINVVEGATVVVYVSLGPEPHLVKIPDLTGRSEGWARDFLDSLKLNLKIVVEEDSHEEIPKGHIIRTDPKVGAVLTKGQTIKIWKSTGKQVQISSMPNLLNEERPRALTLLDELDLDLDIVFEEIYHDTVSAGRVVETVPAAGDKLKTGQTVKLYISKGIEKKVMPDMVKEGMSEKEAIDLLASLGFSAPTVKYEHSEIPAGTVISQSHAGGVEHDITVQVELVISLGLEKKPVPLVVGMDVNNAKDLLEEHGFKNVEIKHVYSSEFPGTVLSQNPSKDEEQLLTVTVVLEVSMGIEKKVMPYFVGMDIEVAQEQLYNLGFTNILAQPVEDPAPQGTVLSQTLGNGQEYQEGQEYEITTMIILRVSTGIERKTMPDLRGMNLEDAKALLAELGFTGEVHVDYLNDAAAKDTVLSQYPARDNKYLPDVEIYLFVSDGPAMVTKDVVIHLLWSADVGSCYITVTRDDDVEVFAGEVPQGTQTITLYGEKGLGLVTYTVSVNGKDSWSVTEEFAFDE